MTEFTDEQIVEAIGAAIGEHEFEVVVSLTKLLALQNPDKAQHCLNLMKLGLELSRRNDVADSRPRMGAQANQDPRSGVTGHRDAERGLGGRE